MKKKTVYSNGRHKEVVKVEDKSKNAEPSSPERKKSGSDTGRK